LDKHNTFGTGAICSLNIVIVFDILFTQVSDVFRV